MFSLANNNICTALCRTEPQSKVVKYSWSIASFSHTFRFLDCLHSSYIKGLPFILGMNIDHLEKKLRFYVVMNSKIKINASYCVALKTYGGKATSACNAECSLKNNTCLLEVNVRQIFKEKYKFLSSNDTLTIYFTFNICESFVHKTIIVTKSQSDENFISRTKEKNNKDGDKKDNYKKKEKNGDGRKENYKEEKEILPQPNSLVIFVIGKKRLSANKNLLCSKSTFFANLLRNNFNVNKAANKDLSTNRENVTVKITNINYNVLKLLLSFVHTGTIDVENYTFEIILKLFKAASKYGMDELKSECVNILIREMTIENVIQILDITSLNKEPFLKAYARNFIKLHLLDIAHTSEFTTLIEKYPELILRIIKENKICTKKADYAWTGYNSSSI